MPQAGRIYFEAGFSNFAMHSPAKLDYERAGRAPLLLVAGDQDHNVPAGTVKSNFKKYRHSESRTDFLEFASRLHLHMAQEGWGKIAEAIDGSLKDALNPAHAATTV